MIVRLWPFHNPPEVGREYVPEKITTLLNTTDYNFIDPNKLKRWHGYFEDHATWYTRFGVRKVLSVEKDKRGVWRIKLSDDLYPDHP